MYAYGTSEVLGRQSAVRPLTAERAYAPRGVNSACSA